MFTESYEHVLYNRDCAEVNCELVVVVCVWLGLRYTLYLSLDKVSSDLLTCTVHARNLEVAID